MSDDGELQPFSRLTLEGNRFAHARLPIDALVELQRYKALVEAAAQSKWRTENPGALLPDDFSNSFELVIDHVEDGSATPVLEWAPSPYETYFDAGREDVESLFQTIVQKWAPPPSSDTDATVVLRDIAEIVRYEEVSALVELDEFRAFGTSLHESEKLRIPLSTSGTTGNSVEITNTTAESALQPFARVIRDRFVVPPPDVVDPQRRYQTSTVAGRLTGMNADKRNFEIVTLMYGEIHGRYNGSPDLTRDLRAVLDSSSQAPVVRITGRMSWESDRLYRILDVGAIELLEVDTEPWSRRVVELTSLSAEWDADDPGSEPIEFAAIDAARDLLRSLGDASGSAGIFPRADGGVIVEWVDHANLLTVEVSADLTFTAFHLDAATSVAAEPGFTNLAEVKEFVRGVLGA